MQDPKMDSEDDEFDLDAPAPKRQRLDDDVPSLKHASPLTLERDISPPLRTQHKSYDSSSTPRESGHQAVDPKKLGPKKTKPNVTAPVVPPQDSSSGAKNENNTKTKQKTGDGNTPGRPEFIRSPFQLTWIRDLPAEQNRDAVTLKDILGDVMIAECWQFNYLFDLDFLMENFDEDVRDIVQVKVVHGSWKREDSHRVHLEDQSKRYGNVQLITAHMPEPFGTHHCKMMVLIRHDDYAQVVIHTANMIAQDWTNMTQAVWRSPLLPLLVDSKGDDQETRQTQGELPPIGTGARFKMDLLNFIGFYGSRLRALFMQLKKYDFSSIRAAFIASVPCRQPLRSSSTASSSGQGTKSVWGWPGLKNVLLHVPHHTATRKSIPSIVVQISSIATLGQTPKWLEHFTSVLSTTSRSSQSHGKPDFASKPTKPKLSIIFPTPSEIRLSLNGYASGGSIHIRLQSAAQQKQLAYLLPHLHHWAPSLTTVFSEAESSRGAQEETAQPVRQAHREPAAPHIKTYIRFSDDSKTQIDWAMLTSANLSTQAWGALATEPKGTGAKNRPVTASSNGDSEVRICSYETGVMVWPALFLDEDDGSKIKPSKAVMVPVFSQDDPIEEDARAAVDAAEESELENGQQCLTVVGLRMPYDLPLVEYGKDEAPWCATASYDEPDWMGVVWRE